MNVRKIIQLIILFIIIIIVYFFIKNTFFKEKKKIIDLDIDEKILLDDKKFTESESNFIIGLNYKSIDTKGNEYLLNADSGEITPEDPNIIILKNVTGKIKLKNKADIDIKSDFAKYNSENFDTFFYQNVSGLFQENKIYSDNLDLLFKDNRVILYNNIKFLDTNIQAQADHIMFDLINEDIVIKMLDNEKKIQIIKN